MGALKEYNFVDGFGGTTVSLNYAFDKTGLFFLSIGLLYYCTRKVAVEYVGIA